MSLLQQHGWTALIAASSLGHIEVVRSLIRAGANTLVVDDYGRTAAQYAEERGFVDVVDILTRVSAIQTDAVSCSSCSCAMWLPPTPL